MKINIGSLNEIYEKIKELNRKNNLIKEKYNNDEKYARTHKRIVQRGDMSIKERQLHEALMLIKEKADEEVLKNTKVLDNEDYFDKGMLKLVVTELKNSVDTPLKPEPLKYINTLVVKEYINEFNGVGNW
jgi:type I restriction enzyme R subunit